MNETTKKVLMVGIPVTIIVLIVTVIWTTGWGLKKKSPEAYAVDLEIWGVFDDTDAYTDVFNEYRKINPYVRSIEYRKMSPETYREDLLNALAAGKGPDLFMIRNAWRPSFEDKIAPAPDILLNEQQYREKLVDVAANDFLSQDKKIYGLPLSVDSLALYYNKDLFNAAGIATPPSTWEEVLEDAKRLSRVDQFGNVTQSGIAMGTAYNINRSTDVLTALMFQLGANLGGTPDAPAVLSDEKGRQALEFYTQFANGSSSFYSWNPRLHYSIDAFYEGTLGMMVNYSWHYQTIKQKNAKLNFGTAPLPQFAGTASQNFANYWGYAVSKNKVAVAPVGQENVKIDQEKQNYLRVHEAWQLLKFMGMPHPDKKVTLMNGITGNTKDFPIAIDPTQKYLERTMKPAARRDLIEAQKTDVVLSPFAFGNLIAKDWYQGSPEAVETILAELIDTVNKGEKSIYDALNAANNRINLERRSGAFDF